MRDEVRWGWYQYQPQRSRSKYRSSFRLPGAKWWWFANWQTGWVVPCPTRTRTIPHLKTRAHTSQLSYSTYTLSHIILLDCIASGNIHLSVSQSVIWHEMIDISLYLVLHRPRPDSLQSPDPSLTHTNHTLSHPLSYPLSWSLVLFWSSFPFSGIVFENLFATCARTV